MPDGQGVVLTAFCPERHVDFLSTATSSSLNLQPLLLAYENESSIIQALANARAMVNSVPVVIIGRLRAVSIRSILYVRALF